jgi:16S rRNA (guanine527-N7)-methyltransferase
MPIDPLIPPSQFLDRAGELGVEFEAGDVDRLGRYLAHLLEANKAFNLTAITDPEEAWTRHILDSLALLPVIGAIEPASEGAPIRVIDVGSGGGLPGIPLAITMPHVEFSLVDATGKKARFLEATARDLALENVTVLQDRAERLGQLGAHRAAYDVAMARAVGNLATLAELLVPLTREGGVSLAIKGAKADEELAAAAEALRLLGATHDQTIQTPTGRIVILAKTKPTPRTYPRRDGEPAAKPLGGDPPTRAPSRPSPRKPSRGRSA